MGLGGTGGAGGGAVLGSVSEVRAADQSTTHWLWFNAYNTNTQSTQPNLAFLVQHVLLFTCLMWSNAVPCKQCNAA